MWIPWEYTPLEAKLCLLCELVDDCETLGKLFNLTKMVRTQSSYLASRKHWIKVNGFCLPSTTVD